MFARSNVCKSGVAEIFGQVVPQTWASHTERLFATDLSQQRVTVIQST